MKKYLSVFALAIILGFTTTSVSYAVIYDITQLTNNSYYDSFPLINANGYVVWEGHDGSDYEIFLVTTGGGECEATIDIPGPSIKNREGNGLPAILNLPENAMWLI